MNHLVYFFVLAFVFSLVLTIKGDGQQTIFNVPSTDVLDRGKVYAELDVSFKPTDPKFSSFVPRFVIGSGGNVEVGMNLTGNIQPGADSTTLVPTVKWRFYENDRKDLAVIVGTNFYIPVRNRTYNFGAYSYTAVSKTIKKTRLTAGGFVFSRDVVA